MLKKVTIEGNQLEYEVHGAGEPAVLIHGSARRGALEGFFLRVAGADWRRSFDALPGSLEMALDDTDNLFRVEIPAMGGWRFTRDDAGRIHQPVLAVVGSESAPVFHEVQELVRSWFPDAELITIPGTDHMLQAVEPRALAEVLASFGRRCRCAEPHAQGLPQRSTAAR